VGVVNVSEAIWYTGDALEVLKTLPSESVDLVITSPPFLALRSYLPAEPSTKTTQ
jgi:DNA modification methylase